MSMSMSMSMSLNNLNLNLGAADSRMGYGGPRYNTEDFPKLMPVPFPAVIPLPTPYPPDWDPELRAWAYVREFIVGIPWPAANDPVTSAYTQLQASPLFVPPTVTPPPAGAIPAANPLTPAQLSNQVLSVLNASIDRADRALEIADQATGQGALNYWTGMLRIDPSKDKHTFLLMLVTRKIGEFVAMGLKDIYKMRRPAQVFPWIMPLFDGPDTPSFPSSHSLQAHLISAALMLALPNAEIWPPRGWPPPPPPVWPPPPLVWPPPPALPPGWPPVWPPPVPAGETARALDHLAGRVAYNREVAGVHYPMDSEAGFYVALFCLFALYAAAAGGTAPLFNQLIIDARAELVNLP